MFRRNMVGCDNHLNMHNMYANLHSLSRMYTVTFTGILSCLTFSDNMNDSEASNISSLLMVTLRHSTGSLPGPKIKTSFTET